MSHLPSRPGCVVNISCQNGTEPERISNFGNKLFDNVQELHEIVRQKWPAAKILEMLPFVLHHLFKSSEIRFLNFYNLHYFVLIFKYYSFKLLSTSNTISCPECSEITTVENGVASMTTNFYIIREADPYYFLCIKKRLAQKKK